MMLKQVKKARAGTAGMWLVKDDNGNILGLLEKYNDTRTDKHPWKAFSGHGATCEYLRAFYAEEGGKTAAIAAVVEAATAEATRPSPARFWN
jgi:hypothetical protein